MTTMTYDAAKPPRSGRLSISETGIYCILGLTAIAVLFLGIEWEAQNAIRGFVSMLNGA